jgi:hypothetical protein
MHNHTKNTPFVQVLIRTLNIAVVCISLKVCVYTQLWRALYVHEYGSWKRERILCVFLKNERDHMLTYYGHKMPPTFKE